MKKICSFLPLLFLLWFGSSTQTTQASHISGGDFSYACIGQDSFLVTLNLFRDCDGITMSTSQTVTFTSTCGGSQTVTFNIVPDTATGNNYTNISQLCSQDSLNSTCFNGTLPGMQLYTYEAIVVLTPPCDTWTMSWSTCCRNTTVNVPSSSGDNVYLEATMNSQTNGCNNSPMFTAQPIPYVCINQPVSYNYGVVEPDGHTLVYSLVPGMQSGTLNLTYGGGASGAVPITGITIDPNTGQLNFTPTQLGNFIVVVQVDEYDAAGNLLGTIMRDIQFVVQNCNNQVPTSGPTLGNVTGSGNQIGPLAVELCEGENVCFDITFSDPDPTDSLRVSVTNLFTVLPGATMTTSGANPMTVSICWTAVANSPAFNSFTIDVNDGACPVAGITSTVIEVNVIGSTTVGPDQIICGPQTAQLQANGGSTFNWSVLSGPPIVVGTNFSCNPCSDPIASPTATTTYVVTSDLTGTCVNTDTVTVVVVPDFQWTLSQSSASACLLEDIDLNVNVTPAGNYTYSWSPAGPLNDPTIPNPTASIITPGANVFTVTMTSDLGCILQDNLTVNVAPNYQPDVSAIASDTTIACGDSTLLQAVLAPSIPISCGLSNTPCGGAPQQLTLGTGTSTNTTTSYPAPYGNWFMGARHQFLVRASELQAMGFNGGQITEMAFDVATINGLTTYSSFEIKMGCTSNTQLTTWETGLVTVLPGASHTLSTGWNTHTFTNGFDWDGISNVVIEVCFNEIPYTGTWTNNSATRYTPTAFNSVLYYNQDNGFTCGGGTGTQSPNRPNMRFTVCDGTAPAGTYSFQWTPNTDIQNDTLQDTYADPLFTTTYQVVVTDNFGGCQDSSEVTIIADCLCEVPIPAMTPPSCNGASDGQIVATPQIIFNPVIFEWFDSNGTLLRTSPATDQNDTLSNIPAGTYTIQITDTMFSCVKDTVIIVTEPTPVVITTSNDTTTCINGNAFVNANATGGNGAPYTYTWDNGLPANASHNITPQGPECYNVFATDNNGCISTTETVCLDLFPPLQVSTSGDETICEGFSVTLTATGSGGSGSALNFQWTDPNGNVLANDAIVTVTPSSPTTQYCVTVTDDCETPPATACLTVNWFLNPAIDFEVDTTSGCFPATVTFTNTTPPGDVGSVLWDFGDNGNTSGATGSVSYTYTDIGCYDIGLTVTSPDGCVSDTVVPQMICIHGYPSANFSFGPQPTNYLNTEINFLNNSIDNDLNFWNFNNGEGFSTLENPTHTFPNDGPGSYDVWLTVTNQYGCLDSIMYTVIIDGEHLLYAPNSFTPNGDGINDVWMPQGEGIDLANYQLFIFDRWGNLIWETNDVYSGWDGTLNGVEPAPIGTYVYKIKSEDQYDDDEFTNIGHINLIR